MDEQNKTQNEAADNILTEEPVVGEAAEAVTDAVGDETETPQAQTRMEDEAAAADEVQAEATEEAPPQAAAPDWKGMYARMTADFDNFRKRTAREREDLFKSAAAQIIKDILPTVDNLALALDKAANPEDPFVAGVKLVYTGLLDMLATHGATPIDSLGEPLNTDFHEAIATLPSAEVEEGHVMNEVKRGWLLNGKLLRVAQVVVSSGKAE